jgi:penicillin-binding protein 2
MTTDAYNALVNDEKKPMFNRAIGGVYPPGSTFKLITAIAGLEEGAIKKDTIVEDTGEITIGPYKFPNWFFLQYGKTDGAVDVVKALQRSNDIYFYKAGEWLGVTKFASWMRRFGIGKPLGIEIGGEAGGLVPDPAWKQKQFTTAEDIEGRNNEWYLGDTYHMSIGQGYVLTTPLQVNAWTNVVANGGKFCKPTIFSQKTKLTPNVCKDMGIKKETIDLVMKGMQKACETGGTGYPFFGFGIRRIKTDDGGSIATSSGTLIQIPIACKTGTAEFGGVKDTTTHAWFTAFAPLPSVASAKEGVPDEKIISGEPEISVTVLLEGAGQGSDKAAPVAKKIMEAWFSR